MHTHACYPVILGWSVFRVIPKGNSICLRLTQSSISQSEFFPHFLQCTKPDGVVVKIYQCVHMSLQMSSVRSRWYPMKKFTSDDAATWRSVHGVRILGHIHVLVHEVRVRLEDKRSHIQMKCMVSWLGKIEIVLNAQRVITESYHTACATLALRSLKELRNSPQPCYFTKMPLHTTAHSTSSMTFHYPFSNTRDPGWQQLNTLPNRINSLAKVVLWQAQCIIIIYWVWLLH